MKVLLPVFNSIPPIAGVPALNTANLTPVYPVSPVEAEALDHWLFGGSADSLIGLKSLRSLALAGAAPEYGQGFISIPGGGCNGLITTIAEPSAFTVCAVAKYNIATASGLSYFGTSQPGNGDGAGFLLDQGANSGSIQLLARPNTQVGVRPASALTGLLDEWMFIALSVSAPDNSWAGRVGGVVGASGTFESQYLPSSRALALGNAYYNAPSGTAFNGPLEVAEFIVFPGTLDADAVNDVYLRSKARLADRGIELL